MDGRTDRMRSSRRRWTAAAIVLAGALPVLLLALPLWALLPGGARLGRLTLAAEVYPEWGRRGWIDFMQRPLVGEPVEGAAAGTELPWSEGRECQVTVGRWTYRLLIFHPTPPGPAVT